MKLALTIIIAILAVAQGQAGTAIEPERKNVTVCVETNGVDQWMLLRAKETAIRIFSDIGVDLMWQSCGETPAGALLIRFETKAPPSASPYALAHALPYEGVHITIFCDRLLRHTNHNKRSLLLGHVVAHEVGHMLQGIARHSGSGLMKACWATSDHFAMLRGQLGFAPEDVELIHFGLNHRRARAQAKL